METPTTLLQQTQHRPWPVPTKRWRYYQEWNKALFLHWQVPPESLQAYLPEGIELDVFEGSAWVSVVPFKLERIRPRGLPAVRLVSDFDELNIRTYVTRNGIPGVYFLSIEAAKPLAAWLARTISGMPYRYSELRHTDSTFTARNPKSNSHLQLEYSIGAPLTPTPLDLWLTERYSVQQDARGVAKTFEVHHLQWPLHALELHQFSLDYPAFNHLLEGPPNHVGYSPGVQVVAWDPY